MPVFKRILMDASQQIEEVQKYEHNHTAIKTIKYQSSEYIIFLKQFQWVSLLNVKCLNKFWLS